MIHDSTIGKLVAPVQLAALGVLFLFLPAAYGASATGQFEKDWASLIAAAQKEGRVVIAAGGAPSREYRSVVELFQKKFGISVSLSTGSGAASVDRVLAERSAGKYTVDLGLTSVAATRTRLIPAKALDPIPPVLILPEVLDKSAWFGGRHWYADPEEEKFSFLYAAEPTETFGFWYNTGVISKKEIEAIKSPADLLDPKWRGKITSRTWGDRGRVGEMQNIYFQPDMGIEWIRAFFGQADAKFSDDVRIRESWVVGGSVPIAFSDGDIDRELAKLEKAGMPVAMRSIPFKLPFLTAGGSGCCIQVYNRAPHPNAAKLYLNWFLSKEGQTAIHQIMPGIARQSMREDIPPGNVAPPYRRVAGKQYIFRDADAKYIAQDKEQRDAIVEAWKSRSPKR
jgi:iron(III) transport system substrate-binding protein